MSLCSPTSGSAVLSGHREDLPHQPPVQLGRALRLALASRLEQKGPRHFWAKRDEGVWLRAKGSLAPQRRLENYLLQARLPLLVPVRLHFCRIWVTSLSFAGPAVSVALTEQTLMQDEPRGPGEALCLGPGGGQPGQTSVSPSAGLKAPLGRMQTKEHVPGAPQRRLGGLVAGKSMRTRERGDLGKAGRQGGHREPEHGDGAR